MFWLRKKKIIFVVHTLIPGLQIYGGPGSLSHDFKIWPITFQGSGPSGPTLFSCEKSHFNKNIHKTCLKKSLKKDKTKILITNGSLVKVKRIAEPLGAFCNTFDLH